MGSIDAELDADGDLARRASTLAAGTRAKTLERAERLADVVGERVVRWAERTAHNPRWDELEMGLCHRDYSPRNWMLCWPYRDCRRPRCEGVRIATLYGKLSAGETATLQSSVPLNRTLQLARAFYGGYGGGAERHHVAIGLLAASHGLSIVDWSLSVVNSEYARFGVEFLEWCAENDD